MIFQKLFGFGTNPLDTCRSLLHWCIVALRLMGYCHLLRFAILLDNDGHGNLCLLNVTPNLSLD